MSLLLDALRKSEDQRRRGELPALDQSLSGSPVGASAHRDPRLRIWLLALLMIVLLAIVMTWWFSRAQNNDPELALNADLLSASTGPSVEMPPAVINTEAVVPVDQGAAESTEQFPSSTETSTSDAPDSAAVVESPEPEAVSSDDRTGADVQVPREPVLANAGPSDIAQSEAEPESIATNEPQRATETLASTSEPILQNPIGTAQTPENEAASSTEPAEAPVSSFIYAWELPLEARQDFPELDVAVHVFALDPTNRFVLINGERYVEGDRLAAGVVLSEITRDGAMVDFRNYRILLQ